MDLRRYLELFRKWLWLIALASLLAAGAAYLASRLSTPVYRASSTLLVNQANNPTSLADYSTLLASQQSAKTYTELLVKRPTLDAVIQNLNLNITSDRLLGQIQVSPVRDTALITVSAEDSDPTRAAAIANELGRVFISQINATQSNRFSTSEQNISNQLETLLGEITSTQQALDAARKNVPAQADDVTRLQLALVQYQSSYSNLLKSYEDLRLARARATESITIAELATVPTRPIRPQTLLNTLLAAIVGATVAAGVAFFIEMMDDTVKSPEDVTALNTASLGLIAQIDPKVFQNRLVVVHASRSPVAEAFRALRTNIQFAGVDRDLRVILVTSPGPSEGKSTVAANLAAALAQGGQRVALVDADLRRPTVHRLFNLPNNSGLTNALIQSDENLGGFLRDSTVDCLQIMVSGALPPNPAELLASERAGLLLDHLESLVDIVIVDTPPCLVVTDAVALSKRADGIVIVTQAGKTRRSALELTIKTLRQVNAPVLGTVLNQYSSRKHSAYSSYEYQYSYVYQDGSKTKQSKYPSPQSILAPILGRFQQSGQSSKRVHTEHLALANNPNSGSAASTPTPKNGTVVPASNPKNGSAVSPADSKAGSVVTPATPKNGSVLPTPNLKMSPPVPPAIHNIPPAADQGS